MYSCYIIYFILGSGYFYVRSEYSELLNAASTKNAWEFSECWNTIEKVEKRIVGDAETIRLIK